MDAPESIESLLNCLSGTAIDSPTAVDLEIGRRRYCTPDELNAFEKPLDWRSNSNRQRARVAIISCFTRCLWLIYHVDKARVAIDGDTMVAGSFEGSNSIAINGDDLTATKDAGGANGAVYVFKRSGSAWVHEAYL